MNSMYFTSEDVKSGLMTQFIEYLCMYSYKSGPIDHAHYNDIHIRPDDCGAFVVEWVQAPWSGEYDGKFEYVGEEQVVCNEVEFPDRHFEYTPEDENVAIKEWLEDNPGWYRDEWGHWHERKLEQPKGQLLDENAAWYEMEKGIGRK